MNATEIKKQVSVKEVCTLPDGVKLLTIGLYDDYLQMPTALEYEGVVYGRTGWNSDKHEVYYKDNKKTATIVK